jgi:hypothetical protein
MHVAITPPLHIPLWNDIFTYLTQIPKAKGNALEGCKTKRNVDGDCPSDSERLWHQKEDKRLG